MINIEYYNTIIVKYITHFYEQQKGVATILLTQSLNTMPDVTHTWPDYTTPANRRVRNGARATVCSLQTQTTSPGYRSPVRPTQSHLRGYRRTQSASAPRHRRPYVHWQGRQESDTPDQEDDVTVTASFDSNKTLYAMARSSVRCQQNSHNETMRLILTDYKNIYIKSLRTGYVVWPRDTFTVMTST